MIPAADPIGGRFQPAADLKVIRPFCGITWCSLYRSDHISL